jgi:threonine dehydrogenase-like Zn-dependent dehydrogenase
MHAVYLTAPRSLVTREVDEPKSQAEALVRLEQVGICGTDVKIYKGEIPVAYPRILGHELIGRVERSGAQDLVPAGTRVLIDPAVACGHCDLCRNDRTNLCQNGALMGRDLDGGLVELVAVGESQLHPIPEGMEPETTALLQVLGTCVHAESRLLSQPGDSAVVVGLGVAGLLHLQLLRERGLRPLVGIARSPDKRSLAMRLGATGVAAPDEAEAIVRDATGGGASLVVEAVGTVETLALAIRLAAPGATILVFGTITGSQAAQLPFYELYFKELTVLNPRAALPRDYDRAIQLAAGGQVQLAPLFARSYPLENVNDAFGDVAGPNRSLKVALTM